MDYARDPSASPAPSAMPRVQAQGSRLTAAGKPFFAFGFNYGGAAHPRALYSLSDSDHSRVHDYLAGMERARRMGANTLRIYLQLFDFVKRSGGRIEPRPRALANLRRVLSAASELGLYLDITGNLVWLPGAAPDWYDRLPGRQRWRVQARFWEIVSRITAPSPAVLCYELTSEPMIATHATPWYTGHLEGFNFVHVIARDARPANRQQLARAWIRTLTAAIREHDAHHLVGIGLRGVTDGAFAPQNVASLLDVLLVHVYPETGHDREAEATVRAFAAPGKPVVLGETFMLRSSSATQRRFLLGSRRYLSGVLTFYPFLRAEQGKTKALTQALYRANLRQFLSLREELMPRR